ncbi:MAG: LCP family protein [Propionibacteriaceae bacterium]|jgi:LCP family protein required for cell wall assembly|nr:LCP family protein [Propionibacteriaceae bacterium]
MSGHLILPPPQPKPETYQRPAPASRRSAPVADEATALLPATPREPQTTQETLPAARDAAPEPLAETAQAPRTTDEPSQPAAASPSEQPEPERKPKPRALFVLQIVGTVVLALVACLGVDAAILSARVARVDLTQRVGVSTGDSTTWLIVGADTKPVTVNGELVMEEDLSLDGSGEAVPVGSRADVIIIVNVPHDGGPATVISIPRDLTVRYDAEGHMERLTLRLKPGLDFLAGSLCEGLGIAVDHAAMVTMDGMVALVDSLGGVEMNVQYATRDADKGLDIPEAGTQLLNGQNALGLVVARHAEQLIDGQWIALSEAEGNVARARYAGQIVDAFMARVKSQAANPVALQQLAWAATEGVTLDSSATLFDLLGLASKIQYTAGDETEDMLLLPADILPMEEANWTAYANDETWAMLNKYGYYAGGCQR